MLANARLYASVADACHVSNHFDCVHAAHLSEIGNALYIADVQNADAEWLEGFAYGGRYLGTDDEMSMFDHLEEHGCTDRFDVGMRASILAAEGH